MESLSEACSSEDSSAGWMMRLNFAPCLPGVFLTGVDVVSSFPGSGVVSGEMFGRWKRLRS